MSAANSVKTQGTTLSVGPAVAGTAKNITAITKSFPVVVTSAAHGFAAGDVVKIAAIVGMVELNGQVGVVINPTTNTFQLAGVDSTSYTTYTSGGTATATPCKISNIEKFSGMDGQASEIDVTDLDSQAKEFVGGLRDFGKFSIDTQTSDTDDGQNVLRSSFAAGIPSPFILTYPNGKGRKFNGFCRSTPENGGTDNVVKGTFEIRISGNVVRF
jgi:hypothetical protein